MNDAERSTAAHCPECGALVSEGIQKCWLCGQDLGRAASQTDRDVSSTISTISRARPIAPQFGLASMMLTVTLICVCLGVGSIAPGLGIFFAIIVTPAFIRTAIGAARRKVEGRPMDVGQKILAFGGSVGVVTVIGVAAAITFFATCYAGGWAALFGLATAVPAAELKVIGWAVGTGVVLGSVAAGYVCYRLIRRLWPSRD